MTGQGELVRLDAVCKIVQGGRQKLSGKDFVEEGGYPAYGAGGKNGNLPAYEFESPGIVLSAIGARCGKCFQPSGKWSSLANTSVFFPDANKADVRFLWYQLNDEKSWRRSGTAQPYIKPSDIKSRLVYLPPLSEQKRIADILDAADALRAKRRESLAQLDAFLQSTFIHMFGDPIANPMGWEVCQLPELVSSARDSLKRGPFGGSLKKEIFKNSGKKVYEQKNVIHDNYSIGKYFIDDVDFNRLKSFEVCPGDLLVSCSGTIGKISMVPYDARPGVMNQALLKIRLDESKIHNYFFIALWRSEPFARRVLGMTHGTGMKNMKSMGELKAIDFICPPTNLQQRFTNIVHQVNKKKTRLYAHLADLDSLFASLQARAFNGEL